MVNFSQKYVLLFSRNIFLLFYLRCYYVFISLSAIIRFFLSFNFSRQIQIRGSIKVPLLWKHMQVLYMHAFIQIRIVLANGTVSVYNKIQFQTYPTTSYKKNLWQFPIYYICILNPCFGNFDVAICKWNCFSQWTVQNTKYSFIWMRRLNNPFFSPTGDLSIKQQISSVWSCFYGWIVGEQFLERWKSWFLKSFVVLLRACVN